MHTTNSLYVEVRIDNEIVNNLVVRYVNGSCIMAESKYDLQSR